MHRTIYWYQSFCKDILGPFVPYFIIFDLWYLHTIKGNCSISPELFLCLFNYRFLPVLVTHEQINVDENFRLNIYKMLAHCLYMDLGGKKTSHFHFTHPGVQGIHWNLKQKYFSNPTRAFWENPHFSRWLNLDLADLVCKEVHESAIFGHCALPFLLG